MDNVLTWFELATADLERAQAFYENVLQIKLEKYTGDNDAMCLFPKSKDAMGGCLLSREGVKPGPGGAVVYIRAQGNMAACEARVKLAGGEVMAPLMKVANVPGEFFVAKDTEGNIVGIHGGF